MFTGIVEETGHVTALEIRPGATKLTFEAKSVLEGTILGDSIAVNGICLTVVSLDTSTFAVEAVPETLRRTNLGNLAVGSSVNLERAVSAGRAMGGHYVQGHIDGIGKVIDMQVEGEAINYNIETTPDLLRYIVPKGFIAVDGTSLTVVDVTATTFSLTLIPHTQQVVVLGRQKVGYVVNLEVDILGKYVEKILVAHLAKLQPTSA
jgi:riboflavin synthase